MLKIGVTATVTAMLCFALVAATGIASQSRVINMKVGDRISLKSNNFQCAALTKKQVACGANKQANHVHVYFTPKELMVVRFDGKNKATVLFRRPR